MKTRIILMCSAALLTSAALANDEANDMDTKGSSGSFASLDADGDGKLSKDEAAANDHIAASFDKLDGNSDGYVTKREFRRNTMHRPKPGP
jgi:Ca2+-binding EF-hand superfamily protein